MDGNGLQVNPPSGARATDTSIRPHGAAAEETPPPASRPVRAAPDNPDRRVRRFEIALQITFLLVVAMLVGQGWETSRALDRAAMRLAVERQNLDARERDQAERDRVVAASRDRVIRQQADLVAAQEAVRQLTRENLKLAADLNRRLSGGD